MELCFSETRRLFAVGSRGLLPLAFAFVGKEIPNRLGIFKLTFSLR